MSKTLHTNPQDELAESLEGIYLVDAGAGTGKTHTILRRYENLIGKGVDPKNILLITFTRNAAAQMRDEVINRFKPGKYSITDFLEAPVMNFHAFCSRLIKNFGTNSPSYLGSKEILPRNFKIIEERVYENDVFRKFFYGFRKKTIKKYKEFYYGLGDNHSAVLSLIKKLSSRGIYPTAKGWFNDGEKLLKGNFEEYSKLFDRLNEAVIGEKGAEIQNQLLNIFKKDDKKINDFMEYETVKFKDNKRIKKEAKEILFEDSNADEKIGFIRHIYHSYIEYLLKRNSLNYDFVVMFAFLLLYNEEKTRDKSRFDYVMVDEFQDTDEIQFLLLMLLCREHNGSANLAVVGDWRQGIYGFRNTTIENITLFAERLEEYKAALNSDIERITYDADNENIKRIIFEYNYRSSQKILDFSRHTLLIEATKKEEADFEKINLNFKKPLTAVRELDDVTEIGFYQAPDEEEESEIRLILEKISELTNDSRYKIREFDNDGKLSAERIVKYSDICILSRKKSFGLKMQDAGLRAGIPVNYEGGLELFASRQGILVLAWFRLILNAKNVLGWLPVLEAEGYNYEEISYLIRNINDNKFELIRNVIEDLLAFRKNLAAKRNNINSVVEAILSRYGFEDEFADTIIIMISKWTASDLISIAELIKLMESSKGERFDIEINKTDNAVVTQTIHLAKGLEYPVVILADLNNGSFPITTNTINELFFHPVPGLRFRKLFGVKGEYSAIFKDWKSEILINMLKTGNYDEERRLLYVAATRAKQYLYFTARRPSDFFNNLSEATGIMPVKDFSYEIKAAEQLQEEITGEIVINTGIIKSRKFVSVHALMDQYSNHDEDFQRLQLYGNQKEMRDRYEFGVNFHKLAQKIASGSEAQSPDEFSDKLEKFISGLNAYEIRPEVDFLYPKGNEIIRGTIDLLAIYADRVDVIDYKTDANKNNLDKYIIQLNIYKEVIQKIYPGKDVHAKVYYVRLNEILDI